MRGPLKHVCHPSTWHFEQQSVFTHLRMPPLRPNQTKISPNSHLRASSFEPIPHASLPAAKRGFPDGNKNKKQVRGTPVAFE